MKKFNINHSQIKIENSDIVTIAPQAGGGMLLLGIILGFIMGKYFDYDKFKKNNVFRKFKNKE